MSPENGQSEALPGKREPFLNALLTARSVKAAAATVGVTVRTGYRFLHEPAFREAYREARRVAIDVAVGRLGQAAADAVDTLLAICANENAPASSRVAAAAQILTHVLKAQELDDLAVRVERIEVLLAENQSPQGGA